MSNIEALVAAMMPFINEYLDQRFASIGGSTSTSSSTTLSTSDYPDALLRDGSRSLLGNLSVASGVTIDGQDISALAESYYNHLTIDAHNRYVDKDDNDTITANHTFSPPAPAAPFTLAANAQGQTVTGLKADQLNKTITGTAGAGVTSSGTLDSGAGVALSVDQAFSPTWTGTHQFNNAANTSALIPRTTDTYDIGTSTKLYRSGWISELNSLIFVENSISVIGGWFFITKDQGNIAADIGTGDTSVDFGKAMVLSDYVLFRTSGVVEYMQVGSLVSGTRYNVSRNLDGSGANAFVAGTVFAVLGNTGNGRIELNASDTPRIQVIKQGASYNSQTEIIRIGDLNGVSPEYVSETYGAIFGTVGTNSPNITIDPTNGIRIRNNVTNLIELTPAGAANISGNLTVTGSVSAASTVTLNTSGIQAEIATGSVTVPQNAYKFTESGTERAGLYMFSDTLSLEKKLKASSPANILIKADAATGQLPSIILDADVNGTVTSRIYVGRPSGTLDKIGLTADVIDMGNAYLEYGSSSFPASPSTNALYADTGNDMWALYDGTRWQTMHEMPLAFQNYSTSPVFSATTVGIAAAILRGDLATYLRRLSAVTLVATTNNSSNYWTISFLAGATTLYSFNSYDASLRPSAGVYYKTETASPTQPASNDLTIYVNVSKVGSPGNLTVYIGGWYRNVLT